MTSDELKAFRATQKWSQQRLADEVEASIHAVQAWEQGKNPIPPLVEKYLLGIRDLSIPIDLARSLMALANEQGASFDEVFFSALRAGLESKKERPKKKG